jgi:uncharacterized linocin/CFP29 family protein
MSDDAPRLPWTDEQWTTVHRIVQEAAGKARVASTFLPLVGPLPPGQTTVPALTLDPATLQTNDQTAFPLTTIACNVELTTQQAEDPELGAARQMLARAAEGIGRIEDAIVFNFNPGGNPVAGFPPIYTDQGGPPNAGLFTVAAFEPVERTRAGDVVSATLVRAIAAAIQALEGDGHYGPFACVLGRDLFLAANSPADSMVFPSDRILPFLECGPLRRSSVVPRGEGVIVALAGSPVDLVVASDVHVKFLQLTTQPRYVLRVSERFVLRIKQPTAVRRLVAGPPRRAPAKATKAAKAPAKAAKAAKADKA